MQGNLILGPAAKFFIRGIPRPALAGKTTAHDRTVCLQQDEVIRLEQRSRVTRLQVKSGRIWLTGSPANGDLLLSAGEQFELRGDWPFVIQALGPAQLSLLQNGWPSDKLTDGQNHSIFGHYVSMC